MTVTLGSLLKKTPKYGINAAATAHSSSLPAYIRITDIDTDGRFFPDPLVSVDSPLSRNYILQDGDIVIARTGASVGKSYRYRESDGELVFAGFLICITPDEKKLDPVFAGYYLQSKPYWDWIAAESVRSGQPGINAQQLMRLELDLPDIQYQREVGSRLSDVDSLISSLELLMAKKQAIKRGMMQELLTGRKRLPGFTKPWKNISIARYSHLKARIGWQGLTTGEYLQSGSYKLVGGTDFKNAKIDWNSASFVSKWRFDQDHNIQLQPDDVLITKDGTIGKVAIVDHLPFPATLNSGVFVVRPIRGAYESRFLYWLLRSSVFENFISSLSAGSTINHLYQKDLITLTLDFPEDFSEQREIASVLDEVDSEIRALESRLESARNIKQGMMQELLTGRVRLPVGVQAR